MQLAAEDLARLSAFELARRSLTMWRLTGVVDAAGGPMLQFTTGHGLAERGLPLPALGIAFENALPTSEWPRGAFTRVLVAFFDVQQWHPWLPDALDMLDSTERGRVERRRLAVDRDQLAICYALHRLLLGRALDCDVREVPIVRDAHGCPRLADGSLFTSLSHADGCIALAVTAAGPVGIDIESASRAKAMPEIAGHICHPVDAAGLAGLVGPAWSAELLTLWVRKEALLKAAGVGLACEMNTFSLPADGLLPLPSPAKELSRLQMLDAGLHWIAAVAAPPGMEVESAWLRPHGSADGRG